VSLRIVTPYISDAATLSSSDFVATLPVQNLQVEGRGRVARTVNATGNKTILGNFAGLSIISALVLYRTNFTSQATWRLELYSGANQTGIKVYDSGTGSALPAIGWGEFQWGLLPWGGSVFTGWGSAFSTMWFDPIGALSFRLTIADAANPAGYLEMKRLLMGNYFEPLVNVEYGLNLQWQDNSTQFRTQGNSIRTDNMALFRVLQGRLPALTQGERATFMEMTRQVALRTEVFMSVFPTVGGSLERDHAMLGKFTSMPNVLHSEFSSYKSDLTFEEV